MEINMRNVVILAAGLALFATSAWSQGMYRDSMSRDRDDHHRGSWQDNRGGWDRDADDRRGGRSMRDDDEDRSGSGASFFLRSGDTQLRVVCGERESTRACVDAALMMFDRVQAQQGTTSRPPAAPSGSPPPAQ
jgi:hypothetical protein